MIKKKIALTTTLLLLLPIVVWAQTEMEDAIYFKNGEILRGEIIERDEDVGSLKIKTAGRNVFLVYLDEVESIKQERVPRAEYYKTSGYVNFSGLTILPGENTTSVSVEMINGYQFTPHFSAGLGLGFTRYNDPLDMIPLFAHLKLKFNASNITPFVALRGGYGFSVHSDDEFELDDHRGGYLYSLALGLQFDVSRQVGWYLQAGYNVENAVYEHEEWQNRVIETDLTYRRVLLGFGLSF